MVSQKQSMSMVHHFYCSSDEKDVFGQLDLPVPGACVARNVCTTCCSCKVKDISIFIDFVVLWPAHIKYYHE